MEVEKLHSRITGPTRVLSLVGGGAAIWFGLRRRSLFGSAVALAGANYAARGLTGENSLLEYIGLAKNGAPYGSGVKIRRSVTIAKPKEELYRFWKSFDNLPHFMQHVESVTILDEKRSHWVVKAPAGRTVEWDAEIVASRENELLGWRSIDGTIAHAGSVRFEDAPANRGTIVRVQLQYNPPAGKIGANIAKLFGEEPDQQVKEDLNRFKRLMEAGEIVTTKGQPSGRAVKSRHGHFAERPAAESLRQTEPVETASEESFPASDAPSWTAGGGR